MRKVFLLLIMFFALQGYGQTAAQYVLARNNAGTPSSIVGVAGTVVTSGLGGDDMTQTNIPIGFTFVYCGTNYTTLSACSNGFISLANSSSNQWTNASGNIVGGMLMPFWDDLTGALPATGAPIDCYYATTGTAPTRVFTFQWGAPSPAGDRWCNNGGGGKASFQVKLYESSNVVEYNYLFSNYSGATAGTVGLANSTSDFLTLPTITSTTANTTFTTSLTGAPAANVVLDWTPPPAISVSPSSLSFTTAPSTTTAGQNVTLVAYGLTAGTIVTAPVNFQVYNGSAWVSSYTVANTTFGPGTYTNATVQVRFVGPATVGTYPGSVTFASTGATTRSVAVTGNVIATCGGTPTAGTVSATATSGSCNPYSPTLSTTGTTSTFGIDYQWQSSSDNISYSNVTGATNTTFTPSISSNIYYRARITCSYSGLSANTTGVLFSYTAPPAAITGSSSVCVGSTITLSSTTTGGTWASSAGTIATVNSSGVVTGAGVGTANITYTASGCPITKAITVNGAPSVIAFAPSSSATVCLGNGAAFTATTTGPTATIISQDFNSGMGSWTITNGAGNATSYWQIRTPPGYDGSTSGDGTPFMQAAPDAISTNTTTAFLSPVFSTVGYTAAVLTYNQEFESYSGDNNVAVQYSINGGSTWTTFINQLGINDYSYSWSAASPQKTVSLPAAAIGQANVKLRWVYNSTWGYWWSVDNIALTGTSSVTYAWTGASELSCTNCNNPTITPTATGANTYSLTATAFTNGCTRTGGVTVTANPLPAAIGGTAVVCTGLTATLTNATTGGTWSSSNSGIANINSSTGVWSGGTTGNATITYTNTATGCFTTTTVTVNPLPAAITGTASACVNASTTLSDAAPSGTWTSGTPGIAGVGLSSGIVNGVLAGLANITYTAPTGCIRTIEVTINPLPATTITPSTAATVCLGDGTPFTANAPAPAFNILLQDFSSGLGLWTLSNISGNAASYWQITSSPASGASGDGTPMLEANSDIAYTSGLQVTTILISPSFSTTGYGSANVSFNQYLLSLTSDANVDVDYSVNGGPWTTLLSQVGVGSSLPGGGTGSWSSATPEVTIPLPPGALGQSNVQLRWHYDAYAGVQWDIDNIKVTAYQPTATYVWTGISGATGLSCTTCGTTTITPTATGSNVYSVTSTTSAGCQSTTGVTVSVNPLPADISGPMEVCVNSTTTLTDATSGGTWSSASANVLVDATSGIVTGVNAATAIVTYMLPTGCVKSAVVTVNPLPAVISGAMQVCEGLTTTLSSTAGGTWTSVVPAVATIGSSDGVVGGIAAGTTDVTYTLTATGCAVWGNVTVNHTPVAIVGVSQLCEAATTTFTNADAGGTWSSSTAGVATIGSSDGVLSAVADGTTTITYQLPEGCTSTMVVTVNPLPDAIIGLLQVCEGLTTTLNSVTPGGTWNSVMPTIATIDNTTGEVTGVAVGTTTIDYTFTATGCTIADVVTVNHTPAAITGPMEVCEGLQTTLSNIDAGGTWASGTTSVATIDGTTGVVSAALAGTTLITYQLPEGCTSTASVTVNALPAVIGGNLQVCEGLTTSLSDATVGGTWSAISSNASVDASGLVTGNIPGVATITYQLPNTCLRTADVTVNPTPAAINGILEVCEGLTTALSNTDAGGTWSSGATGTATVDVNTGIVTGGTAGVATITYELPTTCINTADVTVNPLPVAIGGPSQVCEGLTITLTNTSTGGTWSSTAFGIAVIDGGGVLLGMGAGVTTITYTLPTGCIMTKDITVNALPAAITGGLQVCEGLTTTLSDGTTGGVWSSGITTVANIDASSGVVSAIDAGTTIITYTLPTTCISTAEVTVNPLPATIGGTRVVCEGLTTTLNNADPGGTWNSSANTIAPINAGGVVTGSSAGTAVVTYTLPTGCITSSVVTVNPLPAVINGVMQVCAGLTTSLSNVTPLGSWGSGAISTADVNATTGVVTGFMAGVAPVTYTLPTGCIRTTQVTVNPLPAAIGGTANVCLGATTTLTDGDAGGTWASSAAGIAPINSGTGVVNGTFMGSATITYTLPTGCKITTPFMVNPLPAPITGPSQLCASSSSPFGNGSPAGTWTSSTPLVAMIDNITGVATANAAGTTLITYTLPTGCLRTRTITVNSLPSAISGTMAICQAATTTLANGTPGGTWVSLDLGVATVNTLGVVTGVATGTSTIVYRLSTGCITSAIVTVNAVPNLIATGTVMCQGQSVTLTSTMPGGSWSSSAAGVASVGAGVVTGVGAGSANISYSMPTGCSRSISVLVNPTPAPIVGAIQLCQGATTAMTTATSGGVWTSSTTSVASINLVSGVVTGLAAGTTTISYTMTAGGCLVMHTITVDAMPAAFSGSPIVCAGQTTTLSSSTGGTWTSSNAAVATVGTSGVVAGVAAGNAVITYSLPTGCMRSAIVTVNGLPEAYNMTGGGTYCTGGSGVHIGLDNANGSVSYQLFSGGTAIGSGVTGVTGLPLDFGTVTPAGTYSVLATAASTGCKNSMNGTSTIIIASPVPTLVNYSTSTGSDTMCSGIPVTFTAAAVNGGATPTYQWKVNGVVAAGATSGTYNYIPANGDVVTVNMSSSIACATPAVAIASRTLIVNTSVMPVAGIAVAPGIILCQGNEATFSASALYGGSAPVFIWMKNGSYATTGPTYTYAPGNGDNVYVKLAGNRACTLADTVLSGNLVMTVTPVYTPLVNITATPGNVIQLGTFVTLTAHVTNGGPAPEFQWYIGSMAIAGATSSTLGYNTFANGDSVSCQVKGTGSCSTDGFSSLIMHVGGVGIDPVAEITDVRLMPNPNKGEFAVKGTLSATADREVAMEVTNMLGQVVYKTSVLVQNGAVDTKIRLDNTLANGMYMLTMISGSDRKVFHFVLEQ